MTMRASIFLAATVLLAGGATIVHADDLYQWKDSKGVTHYSDAPPPKGQFAMAWCLRRSASPPRQ